MSQSNHVVATIARQDPMTTLGESDIVLVPSANGVRMIRIPDGQVSSMASASFSGGSVFMVLSRTVGMMGARDFLVMSRYNNLESFGRQFGSRADRLPDLSE